MSYSKRHYAPVGTQLDTMGAIHDNPGKLVIELAAIMGIGYFALADRLQALEARGWATHIVGRKRTWKLTAEGEAVYERHKSIAARHTARTNDNERRGFVCHQSVRRDRVAHCG